jgi:hypothetical protein
MARPESNGGSAVDIDCSRQFIVGRCIPHAATGPSYPLWTPGHLCCLFPSEVEGDRDLKTKIRMQLQCNWSGVGIFIFEHQAEKRR